MSVNDEHPERRADGYWPIVVNEEKTNQFADTAALRRLRHEQDRRGDTLQQLAQTVPRPPGFSDADMNVVLSTYPIFVRSVVASWLGAAVHSGFIFLRTRSAEPGVRRARLIRAVKGWALMPLGVAALMSAVVMPASMYLQGTSMGAKLYAMRARCYGAFGVIDPWAKSLQHAAIQQEQFENVVLPSLEDRPRDPTASVEGVSREELAQSWRIGIAERTQFPIAAKHIARVENDVATLKVARENADILRKNQLIKSKLPPPTRTDPDEPHRRRQFDDDE